MATYKMCCFHSFFLNLKRYLEPILGSREINVLPSSCHIFECTASIQIFISAFLINYADTKQPALV